MWRRRVEDVAQELGRNARGATVLGLAREYPRLVELQGGADTRGDVLCPKGSAEGFAEAHVLAEHVDVEHREDLVRSQRVHRLIDDTDARRV